MNPLLQKLLVVAALLFIATDAFADTTRKPKPVAKGIVELLVNNNDLTGNPALDLPYVDGFRLRSSWALVQPDTTGNPAIDSVNYDWSELDDAIAQAAAHGKFVGISVGAGAFVPNWVYVGSPTVYKYLIDVADDNQAENATEPFPWDVNYLNKWKTFIAAFGAKYDGNPTVRYVVMAGMQQYVQLFFILNTDASQSFNDGLTTGTTNLHSATANFVTGDVRKTVTGVNITEDSVITARVSNSDVTLNKTTTAGSGALFWIEERVTGSDDGDDFKVNELAKSHPTGAAGSWPDYSDVDPVTGHLRHASTAAWIFGTEQIIDAWHAAFPTTELILSTAKPFPDTNEYAGDTGDTVKLYGETLRPLLTGDMGTGLLAVPVPPLPTPTPVARTAPFGQQALHASSAADIYASPAPSPLPLPPQPLIDLMYNGWQKGVQWMELYEEDITDEDPGAVAALQDMHNRLTGATPTPTPTPTTTPTPTPTATPTPTSTPRPTPSPTPSPTVTPTPSPHYLLNISTRVIVRGGDGVLIGGFTIEGDANKDVVFRALGPSLKALGVKRIVPDPSLEVYDSAGTLIQQNDNWTTLPPGTVPLGLEPTNPAESVIVTTLAPGSYTAIVRSVDGTDGNALFELYDLVPGNSGVRNISTRGIAGTGDDVMIGGFIVGGTDPARIIIRAIGPSLAAFGVTGVLPDPVLELHDKDGALIDQNDNWQSDHAQEIIDTNIPPSDEHESAIVATLAAGAYTAIVHDTGTAEGVAQVEVYVLDQ